MQTDDPWDNLEDLKNRVLSGEDVASQEYVKALDMFGIKTEIERTSWEIFTEWCLDKWWSYQRWRSDRADN